MRQRTVDLPNSSLWTPAIPLPDTRIRSTFELSEATGSSPDTPMEMFRRGLN
jgi:hypothetical protein